MYSKTHKFFEFNRQRREQGRVPVPCVWPACTGTVLVREHAPTNGRNYVSYRVQSGHLAGLVRYPICDAHRACIYAAFGEKAKMNGIKAILTGQDAETSNRIGSPMARLVVYEKTNGRCAGCDEALSFKGRWHADHSVPLFKGGVSAFSNLQALCHACHNKKSSEEKREANTLRYGAQRNWASRYQLKATIQRLRTKLSRYESEEEGAA